MAHAARYAGVCWHTIARLVDDGVLRAKKERGRKFVHAGDLEKWVDARNRRAERGLARARTRLQDAALPAPAPAATEKGEGA